MNRPLALVLAGLLVGACAGADAPTKRRTTPSEDSADDAGDDEDTAPRKKSKKKPKKVAASDDDDDNEDEGGGVEEVEMSAKDREREKRRSRDRTKLRRDSLPCFTAPISWRKSRSFMTGSHTPQVIPCDALAILRR